MITVNQIIYPNQELLFEDYAAILKSGVVTNNGPYVRKFEAALEERCGSKALTVCNGTLALHLAIRALGEQGEIITSPFSFIASTSSIIWENCTPVFCDVDPKTLNIDPAEIESKITDKTIAILGIHVFGNPCDIAAIEAIAAKHNLKIIYDGAQAMGSLYKNNSVFNYGDYSTLSLHAYKIVSSMEGGAIFCNNPTYHDLIYKIRYFGKNKDNKEVMLGTNAKMTEFNAAYGMLSLQNLDEELKRRKEISEIYYEQLIECKQIKFQEPTKDAVINHSYFPIILDNEESVLKVIKDAQEKEIVLRRYFYPSITDMAFLQYNSKSTPLALAVAERVVCLPIHSTLSNSDVMGVCSSIIASLK